MSNDNLARKIYTVGIYIRLSQEDRNKKYEQESESVNNQKTLLTNYSNDNNFEIYDYYIDDGFSGTNFDRPGFTRLIKDIETKKINTVLIKDFSRLGREHIEAGHYMEIYFPEKNIRFISLQDGYDSLNKQNGFDTSPLLLTLHDCYSRQNSTKIKAVLDSKRKEGKFIGSSPSFGYMRDPNDKGKLIIDETVAKYVKKIFELRVKNVGLSEIATILNNENVPTPSGYKNIKSSSRLIYKLWTISSVRKILQNEMYIGNMVQNKQSKPSYKSKKKKLLPEEEWINIPNTHEAIIDHETFRIVNEKRVNKEKSCKPSTKREIRLFEGLLYCVECGNKLGVSYKKKNDYWTINCNKYSRDPVRELCTSHFFPYNKLEEQILNELDKLLSELFSYVDINELNTEIIKNSTQSSKVIETKKTNISNEILKIEKSIQTLYQDRIDENITIEEYKLLNTPFQEKLSILKSELDNINKDLIKYKEYEKNIPNYTKSIKKLLNTKNPNRNLINSLLEKIKIDKDRIVTIKFKYNLLEQYSFQYVEDNSVRNPYGRKGKNNLS